jgi:methyltransferase family protein
VRSPAAHAPRRVEPEWLDELPPQDARAIRSRRDLVRVNALMANGGIVVDELQARLRPGALRLAEVGCGDASFALQVVRRLGRRAGAITLLDRASLDGRESRTAFHDAGWEASAVTADVFDWLEDPGTPRFDAIFANLFLHHFEPRPLARMLRLIAPRTQLFVACEPRRSRTALMGSRILGLVGCNDVTRHDAVVSVRAGFSASELSDLWADDAGWSLSERPRGLFSHCFVAERL